MAGKELDIYSKGQYFETIFTSLHTQKNDSIHMHIQGYLERWFGAKTYVVAYL